MGPSRIEFNAHRIFSMTYLLDWLSPKFDIIRFAYIDDLGDIHENISLRRTPYKKQIVAVIMDAHYLY